MGDAFCLHSAEEYRSSTSGGNVHWYSCMDMGAGFTNLVSLCNFRFDSLVKRYPAQESGWNNTGRGTKYYVLYVLYYITY